MKSFITEKGFTNLTEQLKEKKDFLKQLQAEKAHAYTASGDGWHDNPGWTQLGQQEELLSKEIIRLDQRLSQAVRIDPNKIRDSRVQIGSKVTYTMTHKISGKVSSHTMFIVGMGESNVKRQMISYDSPIGNALYNLEPGGECEVQLPSGAAILKVEEVVYE